MDSFHLVSKEASIIFFHQLLAFSFLVRVQMEFIMHLFIMIYVH
ncbi:hypothetical protein BVAD3_41530 (plasmid) [Bacillus velezensis]|nr:hypothetical protein BVAD3_41530 [Bacillus velezensis]